MDHTTLLIIIILVLPRLFSFHDRSIDVAGEV
jgi:hypothetical protein